MIEFKFLGTYKIISNDVDITHKFSFKDKGLLCYILANNQCIFNRDVLANMFWDNYKRESAYSNLRYTIWHLRKIFNEHENDIIIHSRGKNVIEIEEKNVHIDLREWQRLTETYRFENNNSLDILMEISNTYEGDFLKDFYIYDNLEFNDWVFNMKEKLQRLYFEVQMDLAKMYSDNNQIRESINQLNKLIKIDPLNESVYYAIIKFQYQSGNKVAAVNAYRKLKLLLRKELNISPSDKIQEFYHRILKDEFKEEIENTYIPEKIIKNASKEYKNKKITFFISANSICLKKFHQEIAKQTKTGKEYHIDICQSPGKRINYEGIFEILDEVQEYFENYDTSRKLEYDDLVSSIKSSSAIDYYLFNNVTQILDVYMKTDIIIRIWNFHFLDSKSTDFLSFLYRNMRYNKIHIKIIIEEKWMNEKTNFFMESFSKEIGFNQIKAM